MVGKLRRSELLFEGRDQDLPVQQEFPMVETFPTLATFHTAIRAMHHGMLIVFIYLGHVSSFTTTINAIS